MNGYCQVVPWFNSDEWMKVHSDLSNPFANKQDALKTLLIWKSRCPSLPSAIESTLSLLQVYIEDTKATDVADDQLLRLAYSSAIMRFVNHMLDKETIKGSSLYQAAKNLGVPDWIVDLRHDTAHSNNLPNITLLREACTFCLQWLQQNYWDKYKMNIQDYITGQTNDEEDKDKIATLISLLTSLSICAHHNCKIKNLSEIPNTNTRELIVNDIIDLLGDQIDLSNPKTVSVMSIINIINKQYKSLSKSSQVYTEVNEAILEGDCVFLCKDLLYFFSATDFRHKSKLNNNYVQCFELLLSFLHTNDLLLQFILELIKITQNTENQHFKCRLAALWVSEILQALKRTQEFTKKLKVSDKQSKTKKDLKQLYHHWFPSTKGKYLLLDLQKPVPSQLLDINFIQPIIAAYNPYLIYFVRNLLNLIDPSIPNAVAEKVYKLAEVISAPEKFPSSVSTIYTVDDIEKINENMANDDDDDIEITEVEISKDVKVQNDHSSTLSGIWRLASKNHNWSASPIGQLPWQSYNNNIVMETNQN